MTPSRTRWRTSSYRPSDSLESIISCANPSVRLSSCFSLSLTIKPFTSPSFLPMAASHNSFEIRYIGLMPGITSRPAPLRADNNCRVGVGACHCYASPGAAHRRLRAYPAMTRFSPRDKSRSRSNASGVPILYNAHVHLRASA